MNALTLSDAEVEELFAFLKAREGALSGRLIGLLGRVEKILYGRLTVEELEALSRRFSGG